MVELTYNHSRAGRFIKLGDLVTKQPRYATHGMPAGSALNSAFIRVYSIGTYDEFTTKRPGI